MDIENNKWFCIHCQNGFSNKSNLKIHIRRKHPDKFHAADQNISFLCDECGEQFTKLIELKVHKRVHWSVKKKANYICPICNLQETKTNLIAHFNQEHNVSVTYENLEFSTLEDFNVWKKKLEIENVIQFIRKRGTRQSTCGRTTIHFYCHRSGLFRNEGTGKRRLKVQGSCKINGFCPAEIKLKINEGKCHVMYCKTHVGHTLDLEHIKLSFDERKIIAEKIACKIPFSNILDEIRDSVTHCKLQRLHLLTRKDLYNIEKDFKLNSSSVRYQNDALSKELQSELSSVSLEAWVNDNCNKSVLFYKAQGSLSEEYDFLKKEDFVLVLMNEDQKQVLDMHGNDCVCIDGILGLNRHNFDFHSLLVIDDVREAFPCAFLISSRSDESIFQLFFSLITINLGRKLEPRTFMSDMAAPYYNAWKEIVGPVRQRLFCTWHVDREWRKNLNKIVSKEKQVFVYKKLRTVLQETDELAFVNMFSNFLDLLEQDEDTNGFGQYLVQYYGGEIVKCWAYCYRVNGGLNRNMHLEHMHRTLNYIICLQGKTIKRLDKTIQALMKFVENKLQGNGNESNNNSEDNLMMDSDTTEEEEINIIIQDINSNKKISKGNIEKEVADYFKKFVDNMVKNITTREQFNAVKKLLAPIEPTLAALQNNSVAGNTTSNKKSNQIRIKKKGKRS